MDNNEKSIKQLISDLSYSKVDWGVDKYDPDDTTWINVVDNGKVIRQAAYDRLRDRGKNEIEVINELLLEINNSNRPSLPEDPGNHNIGQSLYGSYLSHGVPTILGEPVGETIRQLLLDIGNASIKPLEDFVVRTEDKKAKRKALECLKELGGKDTVLKLCYLAYGERNTEMQDSIYKADISEHEAREILSGDDICLFILELTKEETPESLNILKHFLSDESERIQGKAIQGLTVRQGKLDHDILAEVSDSTIAYMLSHGDLDLVTILSFEPARAAEILWETINLEEEESAITAADIEKTLQSYGEPINEPFLKTLKGLSDVDIAWKLYHGNLALDSLLRLETPQAVNILLEALQLITKSYYGTRLSDGSAFTEEDIKQTLRSYGEAINEPLLNALKGKTSLSKYELARLIHELNVQPQNPDWSYVEMLLMLHDDTSRAQAKTVVIHGNESLRKNLVKAIRDYYGPHSKGNSTIAKNAARILQEINDPPEDEYEQAVYYLALGDFAAFNKLKGSFLDRLRGRRKWWPSVAERSYEFQAWKKENKNKRR